VADLGTGLSMSRLLKRRSVPPAALALAFSLVSGAARADDAVLYRVFLTDGSALASYGEFARVADKVVFSMPLGGTASDPRLELVSVPASAVDWTATERYADAARAAQYASTRGEADYARLTTDVASALNQIAGAANDAARLQLAEKTRSTVAEWSRGSYGYRAHDVSQISAMLDELVSELRVANGQPRFELNLVATIGPPPVVPLLPAPGFAESVDQAFAAAEHSADSSERMTLLEAISKSLESDRSAPEAWRKAARAKVGAALEIERDLDTRYGSLVRRSLARADERASRADVRGIQAIVKKALADDDRLGRRRPNQMSALLAGLDQRLESARRLRLARDRWQERIEGYREYRRNVRTALQTFERSKPLLEDIRALAGPGPKGLDTLESRLAVAVGKLAVLKPPVEMEPVHMLAANVLQLAVNASRSRRRAVESGDLKTAWEASSAAAGALLLVNRVAEELDRYLQPPALR
jgi:hypothetical protein